MRTRHLLYPAVALAVASGLTVVAPVPASAATIDTSAWYQLVNRGTGKALDVYEGSTADGADVVQWAPSTATNQQWQFVSSGSGWYRLKARHSGKVADVNAGSTADGGDVVQWTDTNATNQQWSVTDTTSGYVSILNRRSGKALDVEAGSKTDGANVIQWTNTGATNQQWQLVKVGSGGGGGGGTPPTIPGNLGTHDPSRLVSEGGAHYFYSTGGNLPGWYTTNGSTWQRTPAVFPNGIPASVRNAVPSNDGHDVWAPDVIWNPNAGLFFLYYSVANWDDGSRSAIGLATSPTLNPSSSNYRWTDRGVVIAKTPTANTYNAIDPAPFFDAAGNMWMAFGSGYGSTRETALNIVALNKNTGLRSDNQVRTVQSCGCEAAYVQYHSGYYYLFWNTGGCCSGASSTYVVHVARSTSVTGPYTERSAKFISSTSTRHGPGHIGILSEGGRDYYSYHYYPNSGGSVLGFGTITWGSDGWPTS
ncbi:RICIN domain-containing protein [Micromonospora sp. 067-2]|uniref:RICIN domain-containing protein n=1 Tax=Micromonospora sp. 067-2 TaxID=2789270 RepID=UPI00397B2F3A